MPTSPIRDSGDFDWGFAGSDRPVTIPARGILSDPRRCRARSFCSIAQISQAVSRNPVFTFRLKGGARGDKIEVSWLDNKGETNSTETAVA